MILRSIAVLVAALWAAPAFAQLPEPLDRALSITPEAHPTQWLLLREGRGDASVLVRIAPEADGPRYELIEPANIEQMSDIQAEIWARYQRGNEADDPEPEDTEEENSSSVSIGDYNADALRSSIGEDVALVGEAGRVLTFGFTPVTLPVEGEVPAVFLENFRGEIDVDTSLDQVAAVRFFSTDSFKPNMAARINTLEIEQTFVHEPLLGGPRTRSLSMTIEGSAMFRTFEEVMHMVVEDIEYRVPDSTDG